MEILPFALLGFQVLMAACYGAFTEYDGEGAAIAHYYPFFQDVHVMILVGFGFLMTFLRKYAYSSLGYTLLLTAVTIQASILINGFFHSAFHNEWHKLALGVPSLISGDFAAGAVLISFGAILGRTTPAQLFAMAVCELVFYALNEALGVITFEANDMGGSMFVHTFGAYFGLAVSWMLARNNKPEEEPEASKMSNTTAAIGTLFLWMFWPSFNGAFAEGAAQNRVIVNTVFALSASAVSAFATSKLVRENRRFEMEHILNATLAGGVAVGSVADMTIQPYGAIIVGTVAGSVSVLGYQYLSPALAEHFGIHDTCGVHNLHGIPGLMGGIGGIVIATKQQALFQLAALATTIAISIGGGLLTGLLLRSERCAMTKRLYDDEVCWEVDEEQAFELSPMEKEKSSVVLD